MPIMAYDYVPFSIIWCAQTTLKQLKQTEAKI
jgi:hypothetical protein